MNFITASRVFSPFLQYLKGCLILNAAKDSCILLVERYITLSLKLR